MCIKPESLHICFPSSFGEPQAVISSKPSSYFPPNHSLRFQVATMALQSMPWTFRSALLMGVVQFMWCTVAAIAALGSFVALETVSAPNGDSYRAIDCVNMDPDTKPSCMCNGKTISDVSTQILDGTSGLDQARCTKRYRVRKRLSSLSSVDEGLEPVTSDFQTKQSLR